MPFMTEAEVSAMGFKSIGVGVKLSSKASYYDCEKISIGDYSRIDDFCLISGSVDIGKNVHLAAYCNVAGGEKGVFFSDFSGLAYGCQVFSQSDDYSGRSLTNPTIPEQFKYVTRKPVYIGRHVIVGACSIVMPGVSLAEGCSIGAMSMVTKSTEPWFVYFGIPAKKIKERKKDLIEMEAAYLESISDTI